MPDHPSPSGPQASASDLVNVVRKATARFRDVSVAEAEGYSKGMFVNWHPHVSCDAFAGQR